MRRRQRILQAAGVVTHPEELVQLRDDLTSGCRGVQGLPKAIQEHPKWRGCEDPPESSGRGMQKQMCLRTWEAPIAPGSRAEQAGGGVR